MDFECRCQSSNFEKNIDNHLNQNRIKNAPDQIDMNDKWRIKCELTQKG